MGALPPRAAAKSTMVASPPSAVVYLAVEADFNLGAGEQEAHLLDRGRWIWRAQGANHQRRWKKWWRHE